MQDLLTRDLASLIHPLHDPAVHRSGHVWIRGHGPPLSASALEDAIVREGADTVAMFLAEPVDHRPLPPSSDDFRKSDQTRPFDDG